MKILGMESSGKIASIAIVEDGHIRGEITLDAGITHSQTFLPILDQLLTFCRVELEQIDYLAISEGPGSYTGLRIGIATAKGLALAKSIPVIPVSTLKGLANQLCDFKGDIFALLYARADELYYARYQSDGRTLTETESPKVLHLDEIISIAEECLQLGKTIAFVGDGYFQFASQFQEQLSSAFFVPAAPRHRLLASNIALLAEQMLSKAIPGTELKAVYLKKTQAERECE